MARGSRGCAGPPEGCPCRGKSVFAALFRYSVTRCWALASRWVRAPRSSRGLVTRHSDHSPRPIPSACAPIPRRHRLAIVFHVYSYRTSITHAGESARCRGAPRSRDDSEATERRWRPTGAEPVRGRAGVRAGGAAARAHGSCFGNCVVAEPQDRCIRHSGPGGSTRPDHSSLIIGKFL